MNFRPCRPGSTWFPQRDEVPQRSLRPRRRLCRRPRRPGRARPPHAQPLRRQPRPPRRVPARPGPEDARVAGPAQNANARRSRVSWPATRGGEVNYPGLPTHPDHAHATELLSGFGGMLSIRLTGGATRRAPGRAALPYVAPSLGGVESLVTRPALTSHAGMSPEDRERARVTDDLVGSAAASSTPTTWSPTSTGRWRRSSPGRSVHSRTRVCPQARPHPFDQAISAIDWR